LIRFLFPTALWERDLPFTKGSATSWKSANRLENGNFALGKQQTQMAQPEHQWGNIYIKINSSTAEKANPHMPLN
jgi:hypothetical protein